MCSSPDTILRATDSVYRYLIHNPKTGETAAVDTPCAASYKRELERRGWTLTHILNTHHHHDHVGGNAELKAEGVKVYGPAADGSIPGMDVPLSNSDSLDFGGATAKVIGEFANELYYGYFLSVELYSSCVQMLEGTQWVILRITSLRRRLPS